MKTTGIILLLLAAIILSAACQANYIRDVQGGTVSPSSTAELTGVENAVTCNPYLTRTKRVRLIPDALFLLKCHKNSMWRWDLKIPQNLPSGGRKLFVLSRSVFRTHETDRTSLSCIVMQRPENDSDAFSLSWCFSCLFAFFAPESD